MDSNEASYHEGYDNGFIAGKESIRIPKIEELNKEIKEWENYSF